MRSVGRPGAAAAVGALALALLLAGCSTPGAGPEPTETAAPANPLAAEAPQDPRPSEGAAVSTAAPTWVRIAAIGVDSTLEDLVVDDRGRLVAPVDYDAAGWFSGGVSPGAIGPAIIAGHVDSPTAPAVFARLGELVEGDEVRVGLSDGSELTFTITGFTRSPKAEFPTSAVYSNVPVPQLRLITCAGAFDSSIGHYTDNLIVFAELTG